MNPDGRRRRTPRGAVAPLPRAAGPYAGRKARERAWRRADVVSAARRLFARKGYQRSTMVEIATRSELALGTLYQLFPSKEAISALTNARHDQDEAVRKQVSAALTKLDPDGAAKAGMK